MLWTALNEKMTVNPTRLLAVSILLIVFNGLVNAQSSQLKVYRGTIGSRHIEMRLTSEGRKVSGKYFYDQFKQDLILDGGYNDKDQLELVEGTGKRKTGKFVCKSQQIYDWDLECEWSRPNGTGQAIAYLVEQGIRFKTSTQVVPTLITDRKAKAFASYPQLSASPVTPGMTGFNQLMEVRIKDAIKTFEPEEGGKSLFDTNYNVLFADDEKISVEMSEYTDVGAAHPNTRLWTVNYDLKRNRELTLEDVFRPDEDYKTVLAQYVSNDINRRADQMDREEARLNNQPYKKRDEPVMEPDQLPALDTWGFGLKGFVAYFDFPHVMAVFDRTTIPYSVLDRYLSPGGVVQTVK